MNKNTETFGLARIFELSLRSCFGNKKMRQAGAEQGQAQLKLGLEYTLIVRRCGSYTLGFIVLVGLI